MSFLAIAPEALRGLCVSDKTYHAKNMLVGLRTDMNFNVLKKKCSKMKICTYTLMLVSIDNYQDFSLSVMPFCGIRFLLTFPASVL